MSHLAYASQGTFTLRLATSFMTDVGNKKQNTLQMVLSSITDTFPKLKAECEYCNSPLTSVTQLLPSRSQGPGGQHTGHYANIMQLLFQQVTGECFVTIVGSQIQQQNKVLLTQLYLSGLTFSPCRYIK